MKLFTLYSDLELDASGFDNGINKARSQMKNVKNDMSDLQSESNKTSSVFATTLGTALGQFVGDVAGELANAAINIATEGVTLAGDMEALEARIDSTFGNSASTIEKWAGTTKRAYGLSAISATQYAAQLGDALKQTGASDQELAEMAMALTGIAADMAAFYGYDTATAVEAMLSAFRGEADPIEKFALNMNATAMAAYAMNKGLIEAESGWSKLSEAEKDMVRYSYLMDATARQQGYFSENADNYNQQLAQMEANIEQLKLSVGTSLLPVMTELVGWFNSLFGSQEDAADGIEAVKDSYIDSYASIETTTSNALALITKLEEMEAAGENAADSNVWKALLAELEETLPAIGDLIDVESGRIEGGTEALKAFTEQHRMMSLEIAQQKAVQGMYDEYALLQAEIAQMQIDQMIADRREKTAYDEMQNIVDTMTEIIVSGIASEHNMSAADLLDLGVTSDVRRQVQNLLAANPSDIDGTFGYGNWASEVMPAFGGMFGSLLDYLLAAGYNENIIRTQGAKYGNYLEQYEQYSAVDYSEEIASREALLAAQAEEIGLLEQILTELRNNGAVTVEVTNTIDGEPIASRVIKRITKDVANKGQTGSMMMMR